MKNYESMQLRDYIELCKSKGITFNNATLKQSLEYLEYGNENIAPGSPAVLDGNYVRLHEDRRCPEMDNSIVRLAIIHNMDYTEEEKEIANQLSFKAVFITHEDIRNLINEL